MSDQRDFSDAFDEQVDPPRHDSGGNGSEDGQQPPPRFKLIPFRLLKPTTRPVCLVEGIFPRNGLAVVWGPPKCGKSFWTSDVFLHVALGWLYRDRKVIQGPVVYCAFEGASGFNQRAEAFRRKHNISGETEIPFLLMPTRLSMVRDYRELIRSISLQTSDPAVVVLDTLNRSIDGSESKDEDMTAYMNAADAVRETFNCLVVIIHHCGIDGTRPRGHTSLTGNIEVQIMVKRDEANTIIATVEYMKEGPEGDVVASRLEVVEVEIDDNGKPMTSCVIVPAGEVFKSSKPKPKLSATATAGLRALQDCIADIGQTKPASARVPAGVAYVTLTQWRDYLFKLAVINPEGSGYREQFRRLRIALKNAGVIGIWEEHAWLI